MNESELSQIKQKLEDLQRIVSSLQYANPTGALRQPYTQVLNPVGSFVLLGGTTPCVFSGSPQDIYLELQSFGDFQARLVLSNVADGIPANGFKAIQITQDKTSTSLLSLGSDLAIGTAAAGLAVKSSGSYWPNVIYSTPALPLPPSNPSSTKASLAVCGDTFMPWTQQRTPANSAAAGFLGETCFDADYVYIHTGAAGWKRAALATF